MFGKKKNENTNENFNLYVLRYDYSGNYYVGITNNFKKRMLVHWRRTSKGRRLPKWSELNKSTRGFRFYWFNINKTGVSHSDADKCENRLAELIIEIIEDINSRKFIKAVHVGNGNRIDRKYTYDSKIKINGIKNEFNDIDETIAKYLINPQKLGFQKDGFQIECCNTGYLGKYRRSKHNKSFNEVVH